MTATTDRRDFEVRCDACRRRHGGRGSWLGYVSDHRDLYLFDGLSFRPVERAPGPARDPEYVSVLSGETAAVGAQLRARCQSRHRVNVDRDDLLARLESARRAGVTVIYL